MTLKTLKQQAVTDRAILFDASLPWNEATVFYPKTGAPVSCVIRVKNEDNPEMDGFTGQVPGMVTLIEYLRSDIDRDVKRGERFVITATGRVYVVDGIRDRDDIGVRAVVK